MMPDWLFPPFTSVEDFVGNLLIIVMYFVYAWYLHVRAMNYIHSLPPGMQYLALLQYRFGSKR